MLEDMVCFIVFCFIFIVCLLSETYLNYIRITYIIARIFIYIHGYNYILDNSILEKVTSEVAWFIFT